MDDREYTRLKDLVNDGKRYHYRNFVFAGLIIVLSLKSENESFKLFLDVEFPVKYLIIFLYILTIVYTAITIDILNSIWNVIIDKIDSEIPFNWFVLTGKKSALLSRIWIVFPWIISCIGIILSNTMLNHATLIILGIYLIAFPSYLKNFAYQISNRIDSNEKKMTFSIYLLYWYRLLRSILLMALFIISVVYFFDEWNIESTNKTFKVILIVLLVSFGLRLIGSFIYKFIDRIGIKFGFEKE